MATPTGNAPDVAALPSPSVLRRATIAACAVALALAVGVVLPAETRRDPTGVGAVLGLTKMGQIKVALAQAAAEAAGTPASSPAVLPSDAGVATTSAWRDSMTITLAPNQGLELKLDMPQGDTAYYEWRSDGDEVYFHRHGEPHNAPKDVAAHTYEKGTARDDRGMIVAVYDGVHGWFWRNWSSQELHVTLKTRGAYRVLKTMK